MCRVPFPPVFLNSGTGTQWGVPTASAPAGILFVGREMPEVSRPPVPNLKVPFDSKGYTHTPPRREACVASILPGKEVGTCARKRDR